MGVLLSYTSIEYPVLMGQVSGLQMIHMSGEPLKQSWEVDAEIYCVLWCRVGSTLIR